VCEKLRHPLGKLAGKAGFQALFSRALSLTKPDFPQLGHTKVNADGRLEGAAEIQPALNPEDVLRAEITLVAHMLELLYIFLGETLTSGLLQDVWPNASFNDGTSGQEITA
jgi:hypothetical protein